MTENENIENVEATPTDDVEGHGIASGRFRPDERDLSGDTPWDLRRHGSSQSGRFEDDTEGHAVPDPRTIGGR